jgi:hypothetical protein
MENLFKYFREHDGFIWLGVLLVFGGFKLYPTVQEKFFSPCKSVYEEVTVAEKELRSAINYRNSAVSAFFELEKMETGFRGSDDVGLAYSQMLESDDPVYENRDIVYQLVVMEPNCFSRTDVITSKKEIKNYEIYLENKASDRTRPIYLPGYFKESDFPQWAFKSVIPRDK